jgi:glycosyltransferase involved in cell wall biosynthesis
MGTEVISVCICTYKRPVLLDKLLGRLLGQETEGLFIYSIVVVDNDLSRSAEALVRYYQQKEIVDIFTTMNRARTFPSPGTWLY